MLHWHWGKIWYRCTCIGSESHHFKFKLPSLISFRSASNFIFSSSRSFALSLLSCSSHIIISDFLCSSRPLAISFIAHANDSEDCNTAFLLDIFAVLRLAALSLAIASAVFDLFFLWACFLDQFFYLLWLSYHPHLLTHHPHNLPLILTPQLHRHISLFLDQFPVVKYLQNWSKKVIFSFNRPTEQQKR